MKNISLFISHYFIFSLLHSDVKDIDIHLYIDNENKVCSLLEK